MDHVRSNKAPDKPESFPSWKGSTLLHKQRKAGGRGLADMVRILQWRQEAERMGVGGKGVHVSGEEGFEQGTLFDTVQFRKEELWNGIPAKELVALYGTAVLDDVLVPDSDGESSDDSVPMDSDEDFGSESDSQESEETGSSEYSDEDGDKRDVTHERDDCVVADENADGSDDGGPDFADGEGCVTHGATLEQKDEASETTVRKRVRFLEEPTVVNVGNGRQKSFADKGRGHRKADRGANEEVEDLEREDDVATFEEDDVVKDPQEAVAWRDLLLNLHGAKREQVKKNGVRPLAAIFKLREKGGQGDGSGPPVQDGKQSDGSVKDEAIVKKETIRSYREHVGCHWYFICCACSKCECVHSHRTGDVASQWLDVHGRAGYAR